MTVGFRFKTIHAAQEKRQAELAKAATEVKNARPGAVIEVSAVQFYRASDNDPNQANASYRNKVLEITGTLKDVDLSEEADGYIVILRAGPDEFNTVECYFLPDPAVRGALAKLVPGSRVRIRGKCPGNEAIIGGLYPR